MSAVSIHGKTYAIYYFHGKVLSHEKQREVQVHSTGGYKSSRYEDGVAPVKVHSKTIVHDRFFVLENSGQEHAINLKNWNLSLRDDHYIQMIWVVEPDTTESSYVAINNHNLRKFNYSEEAIKSIADSHYLLHFIGAIILIIGFSFYLKSVLLFFVATFIAWIIYYIASKQVFNELLKSIRDHAH